MVKLAETKQQIDSARKASVQTEMHTQHREFSTTWFTASRLIEFSSIDDLDLTANLQLKYGWPFHCSDGR